MELIHRVHIRGVSGETFVRYNMLASIVAFRRAVPEKHATVESYVV